MRSLILLSTLSALVAAQGFGGECTQWQLGWDGQFTSYLVAECPDSAGDLHASFISLDDCITNSEGQLKAKQGGAAFLSCSSCSTEESDLTCTCRRTVGQAVPSTLDLNGVIWNQEGIVGCFDFPGVEIASIDARPA